ncbi:MAG: hypothetical protein ACWA6U_16320 [Breznakibacter sp.]
MNRILSVTLILMFTFSLCKSQKIKQIKEFKTIKKSIENLAIIPVFVNIKAIDKDKLVINDTIFAKESSDSISNVIYNLLNKKYSIHILKGYSTLSKEYESEFMELFNKLNKSDKYISNIEVPKAIIQRVEKEESRYCVINFLDGVYKTQARIKQEEKELLPTTIAVAIFSLGNAYVTPSKGNFSVMRTIVFDKTDGKVMFYKYSSELGAHPKNYNTIENYIKGNFKSLYYK